MREWARLRYGVFDEHGETKEDTKFPMFYKPLEAQTFVPNICTDEQPILYDLNCEDEILTARTTDVTDDTSDDPEPAVPPIIKLPDYSHCVYTLRPEYKPTSSILSDPNMLKSVNS